MRILCVCTGNTCRSPMLACLLREHLQQADRTDIQVASAGIAAAPGQPASDHAVSCMMKRGLNLATHRSTPVQDLDPLAYDLILCLSGSHYQALVQAGVPRERLHLVAERNGGVPDPYGGELVTYERCARVLENAAEVFVENLPERPR
jgi:protein-tyrosine-phosphatase